MQAYVQMYMYADVYVGICADVDVDVYVGMCANALACAHEYVYADVYVGICALSR